MYSFKVTDCHLCVPVGMAKGSTTSLVSYHSVFLYWHILCDLSLFNFSTPHLCLYLYVQGPAGKDGVPGLPGTVGAKVKSSMWIVSRACRPSLFCFLSFDKEWEADISRKECETICQTAFGLPHTFSFLHHLHPRVTKGYLGHLDQR